MRKTNEQNSKYEIPKINNGITLIALVITVIVMLILVAVTITMAVNGGLFGKATSAGLETNRSVIAEQELGSGKIKIKDGRNIYEYSSINAYFTNTPSKVYEDGEVVAPENPEKDPETPDVEEPETPGDDQNIQIAILGANEVDVRSSIRLTAESVDSSFDASKIEWTSSDPRVATIEDGVVTGINAKLNDGNVVIIAKYNDVEFMKAISVKPVTCSTCLR